MGRDNMTMGFGRRGEQLDQITLRPKSSMWDPLTLTEVKAALQQWISIVDPEGHWHKYALNMVDINRKDIRFAFKWYITCLVFIHIVY